MVAPSSFVPGCASVHVRTWGCAHNSSDGEYMSGMLAQQGYRLTSSKEEADLWLLNSCAVKSPSEDHFRNEVHYELCILFAVQYSSFENDKIVHYTMN